MAQGLGMLRGSTLLVPEQIIFDDEIYHITRIIVEGIDLGTDGTALDVITAVGPRGHFLLEKHTREHTRKMWIPQLSYPRLLPDSPAPDIQDRARAILETILSEHSPEALPSRERKELEAVLNAAKREFEPSA